MQRGSVEQLHALDPFADGPIDAPVVWWCRPDDDAIVLGSRQGPELLDTAACARAGLSIARRRSGGGAVLIRRAEMVWVDVVLPTGSAPDDVRGSMVWIGERWRAVLQRFVPTTLDVHRGGMVVSAWSDLVCFAGVGPGEVLLDGAKLVGLSQRRTRHGIRIQALIHLAPAMHGYRPLFLAPLPDGEPSGQAWLADLGEPDLDSVVHAFAAGLADRTTPV